MASTIKHNIRLTTHAIDKAKSKPKEICLSYDDFMKDFRSIVGYFDKKVVKNYDVNQEQK